MAASKEIYLYLALGEADGTRISGAHRCYFDLHRRKKKKHHQILL
jgi:hypothetical protein